MHRSHIAIAIAVGLAPALAGCLGGMSRDEAVKLTADAVVKAAENIGEAAFARALFCYPPFLGGKQTYKVDAQGLSVTLDEVQPSVAGQSGNAALLTAVMLGFSKLDPAAQEAGVKAMFDPRLCAIEQKVAGGKDIDAGIDLTTRTGWMRAGELRVSDAQVNAALELGKFASEQVTRMVQSGDRKWENIIGELLATARTLIPAALGIPVLTPEIEAQIEPALIQQLRADGWNVPDDWRTSDVAPARTAPTAPAPGG